jgi:hypothetical protein
MKNFQQQQEGLLSREQAADFLGICKTTLDRLNIPKTRLRRRVLYRQIVLEEWLLAHTQTGEGKNAE